jgi:hypothetical protein
MMTLLLHLQGRIGFDCTQRWRDTPDAARRD